MTSPAAPITISLPPAIYCAGSWVEGDVILNVRLLFEDNVQEVRLTLRGAAQTNIEKERRKYRESHTLIQADFDVWRRGTYPEPGTDLIRVPFRFLLPDTLPPSFHYRGWQKSASVLYSITATATRQGAFALNKKVRTPIVVVQKDTAGSVLRAEPQTEWRRAHKEEKLRKGLWGEYSTAWVELSVPDMKGGLPLFTVLPVVIDIQTTTAPLTRAKADAHPPDKPIFPAPPAIHSEITCKLVRKAVIRAQGQSTTVESDAAHLLGSLTDRAVDVDTELPEKQWQWLGDPDGDGKGSWFQRARFQVNVKLSVPPSFRIGTIECQYYLYVKIPFAGLGNDVKVELPVFIVSGIEAPMIYEQPPPAPDQVQPTSDLPPAYGDVNDEEWDGLEKD
ncbi:hypothetical protein C8Q76DRAFT_804011 [Earliella scabrosa]|nr:hypothetical protein C8Q76DRAFT_804011 [Earliella scabrosa]